MTNNTLASQYDLAFVTAMDEEMSSIVKRASNPELQPQVKSDGSKESFREVLNRVALKVGRTLIFPFTVETTEEGLSRNLNCVGCITGIGKVNAALGLDRLLTLTKVKAVINIGLVGAINFSATPKNTVIIPSTASYGDVDVRGFGYLYGQLPSMSGCFFNLGSKSQDLLIKATSMGFPVAGGRLLTTDSFINSKEVKNRILKDVHEAEDKQHAQDASYDKATLAAFDMEGAAFAQCALEHGVELYMIKQVSDSAEEDASAEFSDSAYGIEQIEKEAMANDACGYATALAMKNLQLLADK